VSKQREADRRREEIKNFTLDRYSQSDARDNTVAVNYDNLRTHGFPPEKAREIAKRAADIQNRNLDENVSGGSKLLAKRADGAAEAVRPPHCHVVVPSCWSDD